MNCLKLIFIESIVACTKYLFDIFYIAEYLQFIILLSFPLLLWYPGDCFLCSPFQFYLCSAVCFELHQRETEAVFNYHMIFSLLKACFDFGLNFFACFYLIEKRLKY
jgi:hypothetical protein